MTQVSQSGWCYCITGTGSAGVIKVKRCTDCDIANTYCNKFRENLIIARRFCDGVGVTIVDGVYS